MALLGIKSSTDASITEFIKHRYDDGQFYHAIGNCFVAVNPVHSFLKHISSPENDDPLMIQRFLSGAKNSLPTPHLYRFADSIYNAASGDRISQTVIYRGCCGSGKTETLKSTIQYLLCAESSKRDVTLQVGTTHALGSMNNPLNLPSDANRCSKAIAAALSLYDIMGNSVTENNAHSSRHLKHIKLVYGHDGKLFGAQLTSLLTDLMRFEACGSTPDAAQPQNPVFLMVMVAAGLGARSEEFKITKVHRDAFLPPTGAASKAYQEQLEKQFHHFHNTLLASQVITEEDWNSCLRAVAACINLQCVVLSGSETASISMSTKPFVSNAEELLGLEPGSLSTLILKRPDDRIGRTSGSLVESKPAESKVVLDALSRLIYGRTFKFCLQHCSKQSFPDHDAWLTDLSNAEFGVKGSNTMVHLLDVPGWEQLDVSVSGQLHHLLLHYVEEKLNADYICATFTEEIEKYALEEVELGFIEYPDCGPSIDILEKAPTGIIYLLEEASAQIKVNDRALVDKIMATHLKTKLVKAGGARAAATAFIIKHSFADITYDCEGFITQNKQSHLPDNAITTMGTSNISFIATDVTMAVNALINPGGAAGLEDSSKRSSVRSKAAAAANYLMTKTRIAMNGLMERVAGTDKLSYALCMTTSRSTKESGAVMSAHLATEHLKDQCKYFALSSLVAFAQKGYPFNKPYLDFYKRFRPALAYDTPVLLYPTSDNIKKITANVVEWSKLLVQTLLPLLLMKTTAGALLAEEDEPAYGKSCIFIRERLSNALEEYRTAYQRATGTIALKTQSAFHMRRDRALFRKVKSGVVVLQSLARSRAQRSRFSSKKKLVNTLKALFRMSLCRRRYVLMYAAINLIKSKYCGVMAQRIRYKRLLRAKLCLQGLAKGFIVRSAAINTFKALRTLQRAAKAFLMRRRRSKLMLASAQKVQNRFRGYLVRRKYYHLTKVLAVRRQQRTANKVVRKLQAVWRGKLVTKRFQEVFGAAIKLQSLARMRIERKRFAKMVKMVIWLQCTARRISAHNRSHAIVVTKMVQSELGLLSDLFKKEIASIRNVPNNQRVLGTGYLRNGINKFDRFLISFDVNFDLSFAYPNGWLSTVLDFSRRLRDEDKKSIGKIVSGSHHTVILDDCHNIYTMGLGDVGQLGQNSRLSYPTPRKIEKLSQYLASATPGGSTHPSASGGATLASIGTTIGQNIPIKDVCCGKDHTVMLTASGLVYSWGDNRRGQLGHSKYESSPIPKLVGGVMSKDSGIRQLKHVRIICCGDYHSACLVEPGFVYTWGSGPVLGRTSRDPPHLFPAAFANNQAGTPVRRSSLASVMSVGSHGDLYLGENGTPGRGGRARTLSMQFTSSFPQAGTVPEWDSSQPEIVAFFGRRRIQHVCSGQGHLIVRTGADLFAWGNNKHGQLGDGTTESSAVPVKVLMRPLGETEAGTSELVSGGRHNVLLCKGEIWSWGWNKYGSVGNGSIEDVLRPVRIPISGCTHHTAGAVPDGHKTGPAPQFILSMNVGYRHTMVLSSSQLLFAWGMVNLTNSTEAGAFMASTNPEVTASCNQSVQSSTTSLQLTPINGDSKRRFSVFCDASSTSELFLTPAQVQYTSNVHNPFSDGRFIALRGSSSSSLGYVTIDAEVPSAAPSTPASATKGPSATGAVLRSGTSVEGSGTKPKLKSTATAVRAAMLFASPTRGTPNKGDDLTVSEGSVVSKTPSIASPKPKFNPFLKDHSSKKEEQAALARQLREAVKMLKYTPGVKPQDQSAAAEKSNTNTPSTEAKSSGPGADATANSKTPITPTSLLRTVSAGGNAFGLGDQLRRGSSSSRLPVPTKRSSSPSGSGSTAPSGVPAARLRLSMSLSHGVYQRSIQDSLAEANSSMQSMSLNYTPGTATDNAAGSPAKLPLDDDDLLDLFSPLHLNSIRNNRGQRKRDLVKGSSVRDYFAVFEQKEVTIAPTEDSNKAKKAKTGNVASGVGMPKAEKAFLASYSNTNKGAPGSAIQTADGLINTNITTVTTAGTSAGAAPVASYATPTLSYSWRLASRRKSTSSVNLGAAAAQAIAAAASPTNRSISPTPNRREWSPPPRARAGPATPSSAGQRSSASPGRGLASTSVDPGDSLGLDLAIEKLQSNLAARSAGKTSVRQRGGNNA